MPQTGDINVTIYQGDRRLWSGGKVRLRVMDPFSQTEKILVDKSIGPRTATVLLRGVPADRGQSYIILATVKGHRDAAVYPVKPRAGGLSHTAVMLVKKTPEPDFSTFSFERLREYSPEFTAAMEVGGVDENTFSTLEKERKAGVLNIEAKLRSILLGSVPAAHYIKRVEGIEGIHQDRIFAAVDKQMPVEVEFESRENETFNKIPDWANELSHEGYPLSFKQRVPFGSLQFSFAREPGEDDLIAADIDIDLFTDVGHFGEVIRNRLTRQKTDPYTVAVQLFDQRIFPLYTLV